MRAINWGLRRAFIDPIPAQVADLQHTLAEFPADVILSDQVFGGAEAVHELGGPPWAMLGISALTLRSRDTAPASVILPPDASPLGRLRNRALNAITNRLLVRDAMNHMTYVRWTLGLPPLRRGLFEMISPFLYLHGTTPAFEYPRSDLPPQVHFVGPLIPAPTADFRPPEWWNDLHTMKPVVHVTQGTVATDADTLIVPALQALLDKPDYLQHARRIQADYARHRPAEEAAGLLERLAATKQPLFRDDTRAVQAPLAEVMVSLP